MDLSCNYRAAVLAGASVKRAEPKVRTVEKVRPPTQQEIEKALKVYLEHRYGF